MTQRNTFNDSLRAVVRGWRRKRVLILGDMILDEYVYGRTDRVSREAPVVIVRYDGSSYSPGGAANAAQNVAALGGKAVPVGIIGKDEHGMKLRELLRSRGLSVRGLLTVRNRVTTTKIRIMAGDFHAQRQQIVRIDREVDGPAGRATEERILKRLDREIAAADAVILSDYHQGFFTGRLIRETIGRCRRRSIPVIADSRYRLALFKGVTMATPNEVEAASAAGIELSRSSSPERIGRKLLETLRASSVLVTRGRFGMSLVEPGKRIRSVGVVGSPEATDVTGAGDTVVSAVALTLAAGGDMVTAMHIANIAASIVVMKRGTAVAEADEMQDRMDEIGRAFKETKGVGRP